MRGVPGQGEIRFEFLRVMRGLYQARDMEGSISLLGYAPKFEHEHFKV